MTDPRKKLIRECDELFRQIIYRRDNYTCQRCGSTIKRINCCHFYSRAIKALRWESRNACVLCVGCHFWAHQHPAEFMEWYRQHIGACTFSILQTSKNNRFKTNISNLRIMKMVLETDFKKGDIVK